MSFGEELIILVITLVVLLWLKKSRLNKGNGDNIPGPPAFPLIGNALELTSTTEMLSALLRCNDEFDGIAKVQIGPVRKIIFVTDYKLTEKILSSSKILNKSDDYNFLRPWLGNGLLTSDGDRWKKHRRILTPAFHFNILEQFIKVFESCGNIFVEKLQTEVNKNSVDVYPFVTLCALDIICESIMGVNINAQADSESSYVQSVKDMCRIVIERAISPIQMFDSLYPLTRNYYTQKKALKVLHDFTNSVITKRREELESEIDDVGGSKKPFLDILLQAKVDGKPLTSDEIREEVDTFLFEGHDTTASAISFTLFCLANHPSVQERAYEEQQNLFGNDKYPTISYATLQEMKYLEQVIKETLRLYPSVPIVARSLKEDFEYNSMTFRKGYTIGLFVFGLHRNPKYFDNPEEFRPGRFDNIDGKLPYVYVPFSAGSRNCIGQKFAMLEMKSVISKVIRHFELRPATPKHELKLASEAILKSVNGINIRFTPRC